MRLSHILSNHFVFAVLFFSFSPSVFAIPAQVLIIRHAEKPPEGNHLNEKGYARAEALPQLWMNHKLLSQFGKPEALYASYKKGKSVRSVETLMPTAKAFNLKINSSYEKDETQELATELLNEKEFNGKTVIVAWQHSNIIPMIEYLGVQNGPQEWPDEIFNEVYVVRFGKTGAKLKIIPQCLLPGDCAR